MENLEKEISDFVASTKALVAETKTALESNANETKKAIEGLTNEIKTAVVPAVKSDDKNPEEGFFVNVGRFYSMKSSPDQKQKAYNILEKKWNAVQKDAPLSFMEQSVGAAGGFIVPQEWLAEIVRVEGYEPIALNRARIIPTAIRTVNVPALDQTVTPSDGSSAFYGGVAVSWQAEGVSPSSYTLPNFKQVVLTVMKQLSVTQVSNELLAMSPVSIEDEVSKDLRGAAVQNMEYNILNGDGSTTGFSGIVDNAATITVARGTAGEVTLADLAAMWARLTPQGRKSAVWCINPSVWGQLPLLGSSGGAAAHFVWLGNSATGAPEPRLFGLPIYDTENLPVLGSAADVCLIDFSKYLVAMNTQVTIDASPHYAFPSDLTTYRLRALVAGKPQQTAPIKLATGGTNNTVSSYIQLDSVAS